MLRVPPGVDSSIPVAKPTVPESPPESENAKCIRPREPMVRASLMGGHSHAALNGVRVHVWRRGKKYIVRSRINGQIFGETIGESDVEAAARLRQILTEIDFGAYVRPSEKRKRLVANGRNCRWTLRQLTAEFLAEKRRSRGRQTAGDYRSRLSPVLDFVEKSANLKRWPLAQDVDAEFVRCLRAFLFEYQSTRNGRPGGKPRPLSARQIINVLECLRTMLHWARSAPVRKLAADWVMPLDRDVIGAPAAKNPLRADKLPLEARIEIVRRMDLWQLCQLSLSLVLPLRPDEAAGLLIGDVNFEKGWLEFGERLRDCNFTKGKTAFMLPFPDELRSVLRACIADRCEGPLLRSRRAFEGRQSVERVASLDNLVQLYQESALNQPEGTIQADQDRKLLFRALLVQLGGVTEDSLSKEFKKLLTAASIGNGATLYTLRSSVTTAMHRANLPHLELRYLTAHTTGDILNEYTSLDPVGAIQRYFDVIRPLLDAIEKRAAALCVPRPDAGLGALGSP